ncbi:transcription termination/antitermination NusG family protein [uncultured Treponema sp.]|uniref:transcription termination/antitermination NusG family protein n=1 Tax=uncultured Treponema sp. TaxID=162155 RepID=UPI0015B9DA83|nr:transcription termination/antitermination NusG family protein [uncultured Treponema sp.]
MEYYCIMVKTGEEKAFKERAIKALKEKFPEVQLFFFQRMLRSNRGEYFERPLFPGYLFLAVEKLSGDFFLLLKKQKDFGRILMDNRNPTVLAGQALEELKIFIHNGEHWGVSKISFLPGQRIKVISGPLLGLEGLVYKVNKKRKRVTILSSLSPDGKRFDLYYEDVAPADVSLDVPAGRLSEKEETGV